MSKKIIDKTETTKDGIETVRCGDTLQMLGKSFIQDGVRYFVPMLLHRVVMFYNTEIYHTKTKQR